MDASDLQLTSPDKMAETRASETIIHTRRWPIAAFTLRTKLIIAFLVVSLVPLGLLSYLNSRTSRAALTNAANQALFATASQTVAALDNFFNANLDAISAEAQLGAFEKYLSLPAEQRLGSAEEAQVVTILRAAGRRDTANISSYALLDRYGQNIVDTFAPDIGLDEQSFDYFQVPLETDEPYASPVMLGELPGQAYVYFSSPVHNESGEIVGVLRASYNASVLQQLLAQSNDLAGPDSFGILFDENHIHLAHGTKPKTIFKFLAPPDPARVSELKAARRLPDLPIGQLSTSLPVLDQQLATSTDQPFFVTEDAAAGGRINRVAVARMKTQPWLVAFFEPQDVYLAPVKAQSRTVALLAVVIAGMVAGVAAGVGQLLAGPVTRLTAVADRIGGGDLTAQAEVEAGDEIGTLAATFNHMTTRLRELITDLERQVAKRTRDLERRAVQLQAAAEVGQAATSIRELDQLLNQVTHLISERFGFYHVGIFLTDDTSEYAVLRAANSDGGQRMLARGHKLRVGQQGIVGYATGMGEPRIALDVGSDAMYFDNPDMPDTRSEMALPLVAGTRVLGALDVQSIEEAVFTQEDIEVLQILANQVAVAIDNARLFAEVQQALEAERRAYGELSRQAWEETLRARPDLGFCSDERGVSIARDVWRPEMEQALRKGRTIQISNPKSRQLDAYGKQTSSPLAVPIKVRGQVVGVLDTHKPGDADPWTPEEIDTLEHIIEQLGSALESARLYQDVQRSAARERLTREITDQMRRATSVDGIVQTTVDALFTVMGTSGAFLRLEGALPAEDGGEDGHKP
ncbi:MAG: GAF domain-containing protein [Anaerolineales bacterium]|nr:MAG: GAF domain-containing protein [Anaerolineales bacterium]